MKPKRLPLQLLELERELTQTLASTEGTSILTPTEIPTDDHASPSTQPAISESSPITPLLESSLVMESLSIDYDSDVPNDSIKFFSRKLFQLICKSK